MVSAGDVMLQRRLFPVWFTRAVQRRLTDYVIAGWVGLLWHGAASACSCTGHPHVT